MGAHKYNTYKEGHHVSGTLYFDNVPVSKTSLKFAFGRSGYSSVPVSLFEHLNAEPCTARTPRIRKARELKPSQLPATPRTPRSLRSPFGPESEGKQVLK